MRVHHFGAQGLLDEGQRGTPDAGAAAQGVDLCTAVRLAPPVITRPRWLYEFARSGPLPDLTAPNLATRGGSAPPSSAPTTSG